MRSAGLNTYAYGPKDDLKHRACWRECYDEEEARSLRQLIATCHAHQLRFLYALGPGLDVRYAEGDDANLIHSRFNQMLEMGADDVALLFDDIPDIMRPEDADQFESFAAAHAHVATAVFHKLREVSPDLRFLFCPTPYCSRMDRTNLGGEGYLDTLGEKLDPNIAIFWTGPEIISESIDEAHCREVGDRLNRMPVIWDNLQANDYDLRRLFLGPCQKRPKDPENALSGILINPNCEFEANFVPIHTLGTYVSKRSDYKAQVAYDAALEAWLPEFASTGEAWTLEEVRLLGEIFYLPHEDGAAARQLLEDANIIAGSAPDQWGGSGIRVRDLFQLVERIAEKLTELKNRDLFYTFNRQWWELREELQLLTQYMDWRQHEGVAKDFHPPDHLPGTFRGGVVARLQQCLTMASSGAVHPAH